MRLKQIRFGDDERAEEITVSMSMDEAAFIAKFMGDLYGDKINEILPGFADKVNDVYSCLVGSVFNRLYGNGVDGYINNEYGESW